MDITAIKKMKDDVSESFSGLSSGVNGTISEFSHFIAMMDPYIEYFFPEVRELILLSEISLFLQNQILLKRWRVLSQLCMAILRYMIP